MSKLIRTFFAIAALLALAPSAMAAANPAHKVFEDPLNDGGLLQPDFTPPCQDLTAGYISDSADSISFTWEVADLSAIVDTGARPPTVAPVCIEAAARCEGVRRGV